MVILGIDPSLRGTGWGVISADGGRLAGLAWGVLRNPPSRSVSDCLAEIHRGIAAAIAAHVPRVAAVEALFHARNVRTALVMGQARGAALVAAAEAGLEVFEYAPKRVKQGVVGVGGAAKSQVGFMIRALLGLVETPPPDAADALAVAITHAHAARGAPRRG
ncbi:MAG: crossover junction endodeoxyribonuclease RuvC [Verrucomicrobiae bacterium]|nr:crossover junction endodeoxyribonuclease RuvC [Verrucomicrobiae bacterium]